jgi:hypothetical protein
MFSFHYEVLCNIKSLQGRFLIHTNFKKKFVITKCSKKLFQYTIFFVICLNDFLVN